MTAVDLVRASRDGDQFHYVWAARQCLGLLTAQGGLEAVTIEGASTAEAPDEDIDAGEELIDVGLYYSSERLNEASAIRYVQLKHSTAQTGEPWTASGLKRTLGGFAKRYEQLVARSSREDVAARFTFQFTTNRPIDQRVIDALEDLREGKQARHSDLEALLLRYAGLDQDLAVAFFQLFRAEGFENDLWAQQNLLIEDLRAYLPEADSDAPVQLKELVTRKATTQFTDNPRILRYDVLRALKTGEDELFPAPPLIEGASEAFAREQEPEIIQAVVAATAPVLLHADGGVGKSMVATRLALAMPAGSVTIVYDCFGTGLYRSAVDFRHRHRDGLVQIANELAARSLCFPLIPSAHADPKAYIRAFLHRLRQASTVLRAGAPDALLCLVIDAADNAEMAAAAQQEPSSFARDLIRAPLPEGVRLVFTSRSHRRASLEAPPETIEIALRPFNLAETAVHLRRAYPTATDSEAAEFDYLTSSNPRVQALAMDQKRPLPDMLAALGPNPTTIEAAIGELLAGAIKGLKDKARGVGEQQIEQICQGLAVLRPLVPISVLSRLTGVDEGAIRTFAFDLGRPLLVRGDSLHFLDEPAETWFRETFTPDADGLKTFVDRLRPLANSSSYVAGAIPQLLLEAGRYDELVELALSTEALPSDSPLERRDVELQRLIFALKACLHIKTYLSAAKLALKAAGETAAENRQNALLQSNIHLAGVLLAPDRLQELVSRRTFGSGWRGAHHVYDAALLSARPEFSADASSRLRMAADWLSAWARAPSDDDEDASPNGGVTDDDRAAFCLAYLRLKGAKAAAGFLRRWRHRPISFTAGGVLAAKLIDLGEVDALGALASSCRNDIWLLLALARAFKSCGLAMPVPALERLLRILSDRRVKLPEANEWNEKWEVLGAVTAAVELAIAQLPPAPERWAALIRRYLPAVPPHAFTSDLPYDRAQVLRPYVLEAALRGQPLDLVDIAPKDVRAELEREPKPYNSSRDCETFLRETGGILPWVQLGVDIVCSRAPADLGAAIGAAAHAGDKAAQRDHREAFQLRNATAIEWLSTLRQTGLIGGGELDDFNTWRIGATVPLWPQTLTTLCRIAARTNGLENLAHALCNETLSALEASREDAQERTDAYLQLARAIYPVSPDEAAAVLDRAVAIADRIGEENLDRWSALLHLAQSAGSGDAPRPRSAYRLARAAELTYEYVVRDKHFAWDDTAKALAALSPSSCLAIFSRWRDRRFGHPGRLLPIAIERLVEKQQLPALALPVLAGVDAWWSRLENLKAFLTLEPLAWRRTHGAAIAYRYIRLQPQEPDSWDTLAGLAGQHGLDFSDLDRLRQASHAAAAADAAAAVAEAAEAEAKAKAAEAKAAAEAQAKTSADDQASAAVGPPAVEARPKREEPDWDAIFKETDLRSSQSLREARRRWRTFGPPFFFGNFAGEAARRTKSGQESQLLRAISEWPDFDIYSLHSFLEGAPEVWLDRLAYRQALRTAILAVCRRDPTRVYRRGWARIIPFDALFAKGVLTEPEVVAATIGGFTDLVGVLDAGGLFHLLDPIAASLTPDQADEALHYGLDLFEPTLTEDDGDGPWTDALAPAEDLIEALAGYIWAGLASPIASQRWAFAHVVRNAVELDWRALLEAMARLAVAGVAGPFVDQRLPFYDWHARQWLILGLARGALSKPAALAPFVALLEDAALDEHVVIAEFARRCLLSWASTPEGKDLQLSKLGEVNRPVHPTTVFKSWYRDEEAENEKAEVAVPDDDKYYFGHDIGQYWLGRMGRIFGLSQGATERRVLKVIRERLGASGGGGWRNDARHTRKVFNDGEAYHSHGETPKTDNLSAYEAYHAMMLTAGALLKTRAVGRQAEADDDDFADWMDDRLLRRADGRWLFDRMDPAPARPKGEGRSSDSDWAWSVTREHLDAQLATADGRTVLWGNWTNGTSYRSEAVRVRSALVSESAAPALLATLQTAAEPGRLSLPDADRSDSLEIGEAQLFGWVVDQSYGAGLDDLDAWSERLHYPGARPAPDIVTKLALEPDLDDRCWRSQCGATLLSESSTIIEGSGRDETTSPCWRLSSDNRGIAALLEAHPGECLILTVTVRRDLPEYARRNGEFEEYPWPYFRSYLMSSDGVASPL